MFTLLYVTLTNLSLNEFCIKFLLLWVSDFGKTHIWAFSNYQTTCKVFKHYDDVIMNEMASLITSLTIVYSSVFRAQTKENIKAPRHWPLCGEFTGDRWIPRTKVQERGKGFHLMVSSCSVIRKRAGCIDTPHYCMREILSKMSNKQTDGGIFVSFCRVFQNTMLVPKRKSKYGYSCTQSTTGN